MRDKSYEKRNVYGSYDAYKKSNFKEKRYKKKRHKKRRQGCLISVLSLIVIFVLMGSGFKFFMSAYEGQKIENGIGLLQSEPQVDLSKLHSSCGILVDLDSGKTVAKRHAGEKIYPASLTKMMTAIVAIENTEDLNEYITLPVDIFQPLYEENASLAGFWPGERACKKDLLYGIILPSGAECCLAFAKDIAGSEERFVEMMNQKAKDIGMEHTHFSNSTGLHDTDHYSTVEDMAALLAYALKNPTFRAIFTSRRYSTQPTNQHPEGFTFYSTLFSKLESVQVAGCEIIGGKTGYTEEAGLCLASLAQMNGKEYIFVSAKAKGSHETEPFHILDAINVYQQIGDN